MRVAERNTGTFWIFHLCCFIWGQGEIISLHLHSCPCDSLCRCQIFTLNVLHKIYVIFFTVKLKWTVNGKCVNSVWELLMTWNSNGILQLRELRVAVGTVMQSVQLSKVKDWGGSWIREVGCVVLLLRKQLLPTCVGNLCVVLGERGEE